MTVTDDVAARVLASTDGIAERFGAVGPLRVPTAGEACRDEWGELVRALGVRLGVTGRRVAGVLATIRMPGGGSWLSRDGIAFEEWLGVYGRHRGVDAYGQDNPALGSLAADVCAVVEARRAAKAIAAGEATVAEARRWAADPAEEAELLDIDQWEAELVEWQPEEGDDVMELSVVRDGVTWRLVDNRADVWASATIERGAMTELPADVAAWLERLVYPAKRDYAEQYAAHVFCGGDAPPDLDAAWARKARARVDRFAR